MNFWRLMSLMILALCSTRLWATDYVVVVLDDSGSMKQSMPDGLSRMEAAKQSLVAVLSQLPAETNVGVLTLNTVADGGSWVVPVGPVGKSNWRSRVGGIQANGGTPLGQFIKDAADTLLKLRAADRYGNFRLLIITDGEASDPQNLRQYLPDVLSRGLTMDVIGVSMAGEHSLAKLSHSYRSAADASSLTAAISEVFAEPVDDADSAAADFALLEGLPDGFAEAAIQALTIVRNDPIEAKEPPADEGETRFEFRTQPAQTIKVSTSWSRLSLGLLCCCGGVVLLFSISAFLLAQKRNRRR
jgi:uncharacterized protein YegL